MGGGHQAAVRRGVRRLTQQTATFCSTCGEPLGDVVYTEHCGPHLLADFIRTPGYSVDVGDMYGNWDFPDYFVVPLNKLGPVRVLYKHKKGCCYWRDIPMADDSNWCRMCEDVMEPTYG